jgi:hypothetical protein
LPLVRCRGGGMRRDAGIVEEDERRSVSKRLGQSMSRSEVGQTGTNCWKWAKPEASDEAHVRPYARGAFKKNMRGGPDVWECCQELG